MKRIVFCALLVLPAVAACGGSSGTTTPASTPAPGSSSVPASSGLAVPSGLIIQTIAHVGGARELVALPNGDLLVGTLGSNVYIVPNAEASGMPANPTVFATVPSEAIPPGEPSGGNNAEGIAFDPTSSTVFIATEYHVYATPYKTGDQSAENVQAIQTVRTGPTANPADDNHTSTSLAVSGTTLYASMGSSCNGCTTETDPERAAIWKMNFDGSGMTLVAEHIRNAIALAVDPLSGHLWAGGAGQDDLPTYHPYEFMDDVTAAAATAGGVANYGWPYCEENHQLYVTGSGAPANCNAQAVPLVEFPAYITHIGAVFYPLHESGAYAFPSSYDGALIVTSHGSWHTPNGCTIAPEVDAVPMHGDTPVTAMTAWGSTAAAAQYTHLVTGFQSGCTTRIGRATGVAVGSQGSVFIGDDQAGVIYRVRP